MQKFLAGVLCAVMAFSAAAISASADDELLTPENASNISQKEKIISSLLKNENEWLDYSKGGSKTIQFIDLDFDGNLEFVTSISTTNGNLYSNIFNLRTVDYDGFVKTSGEQETTVSPLGLKGYFDNDKGTYRMIGDSFTKSTQDSIGVGEFNYHYEVVSSGANGRNFDNKTIAYYRSENNVTTYYDANKKVISESDYNTICDDYVNGLINVNMKFDSFTIQDENGVIYYDSLTEDEKRAKLEELYDSFTYDKYRTVDSKPESKPESKTESTPSSENNNSNNSTNSNTNTSSSNNNGAKSPQTGSKNSFGLLLSVVLAGGVAAAFAGFKRREDI